MLACRVFGKMSEEDEDELNSDGLPVTEGYCHYTDNDQSEFSINLMGFDLEIVQKPTSTDLGIGAVVWDSSVIFAKYVEYHPELFRNELWAGKTVLELGNFKSLSSGLKTLICDLDLSGAGCGLAGLALLMKGAQVTFTDLSNVLEQMTIPNVCKAYRKLKSTATLQHPIHEPVCCELDWTTFVRDESIRSGFLSSYDTILLTDCVFSASVSVDLVQTINLCSTSKTVIYCCYEIRDVVRVVSFCCQLCLTIRCVLGNQQSIFGRAGKAFCVQIYCQEEAASILPVAACSNYNR